MKMKLLAAAVMVLLWLSARQADAADCPCTGSKVCECGPQCPCAEPTQFVQLFPRLRGQQSTVQPQSSCPGGVCAGTVTVAGPVPVVSKDIPVAPAPVQFDAGPTVAAPQRQFLHVRENIQARRAARGK